MKERLQKQGRRMGVWRETCEGKDGRTQEGLSGKEMSGYKRGRNSGGKAAAI